MTDIQGFVLAILPISLSPGASFTLTMSNVSVQGMKGANKVMLGTGLGLLVHGAFVGVGVSAFVASQIWLLNLLKIAGIGFLMYLGAKLLHAGFRARSGAFPILKVVGVKEALFFNVFNAKAFLVYLTVVPLYAGNTLDSYILLSLIHICIMVAWLTSFSFLYVGAKQKIAFSKLSTVINIVGGLWLIYLSGASALQFIGA